MWNRGTRRLEPETRRYMLRLVAAIAAIAATCAFLITTFFETDLANAGLIRALILFSGVYVLGVIWLSTWSDDVLDRHQAAYLWVLFVLGAVIIDTAVFAVGPHNGLGYLAAAALIIPAIIVVYVFPRRRALIFIGVTVLGIAIPIVVQPGWIAPPVMIVLALSYLYTGALLVGGIVERHDQIAHREHEAREEIAALNATLQKRVDEQVEEIQSLGELRRFLSPQIADVVASRDADTILAPHRKEIAVFFSDLRNYTRFTVGEAPEDVLTALDEYYGIVCAILERHNATIGNFSGDGVMAFLNDPLPHDDPAGAAVRIAVEIRSDMVALLDRWEKRGFTLGCGVGIAMGYATIGLLGNETRSDYTAVGPVVNLASRLCAEAQNGQVLVDHRTYSAVKAWAITEKLDPVTLKGFPDAVPTYSVTGLASG